jgi:hypothetical protein
VMVIMSSVGCWDSFDRREFVEVEAPFSFVIDVGLRRGIAGKTDATYSPQ